MIQTTEESKATEDINRKMLKDYEEKAKEIRSKLPKRARRKILPQALSDEEFYKVIDSIKNKGTFKKIRVAMLLAYESGLRISEILSLQKEDVDQVGKTIFVRRGKFSKDRVVPLPKNWKSYMIEFIPFQYKNILAGKRSLEIIFKKRIRKLGLNPNYHFHNLRHSFATHCLEKGMPLNQLQIFMGHSNLSSTNVYVQANPKDALKKYEEIF